MRLGKRERSRELEREEVEGLVSNLPLFVITRVPFRT
jgi:hypothetical protein